MDLFVIFIMNLLSSVGLYLLCTALVNLPQLPIWRNVMPSLVRHRCLPIAFAGMLAVVSLQCFAAAPKPLPALNIDIQQTSVSGISSGGFMSVQFQIAHSAIVKGAGIVAGGPYNCAQDNVLTATTQCSCTGAPLLLCEVTPTSTKVAALVSATRDRYHASLIDDPANLTQQRILTIAGGKDPLVPLPVARQLADYYAQLGVPASQFSAVTLDKAGHTMPTQAYGNACSVTDEPYLGKCQFDSAKAILSWIYGPLQAPTVTKAKGKFIRFDQKPYIPADGALSFLWKSGLDSSGWLYVPDSCAKGAACRLHIALHGCKQGQSYLPLKTPPGGGLYYGTTFVKNAGYDRWADNNNIVVVFPQAVSIPGVNPNACWDWWGYTDAHYADQQGVQIRALRAMAGQLSSGMAH